MRLNPLVNKHPNLVSQTSFDVLKNTITKIRNQFLVFTYIESQFVSYNEKTFEMSDIEYDTDNQ